MYFIWLITFLFIIIFSLIKICLGKIIKNNHLVIHF